ncbi:uncharacterized protein LACBIDRAFT_312916 [Laccaria bicolor S238N-H82]|uniref:Cysteine proteinase 1, mitochondrial n=1 Tax=Laccaria bicolor (strain S238N-H82 / ATCC MYA-4686) TaxID=486041 RepID=B0DX43_LACBS|nr:uncharacterized protein LACBIDRAFT_312916 [Laccaria bicolor S238N-H82]EDR00928.1 predicted protein [Laccaria bicolor S238N-H82]|eukprot:XP_001888522.1 predicted protein [Laccaria bicolor S238N-H82]
MGVNISRPKLASQYDRPPPKYEESLEHEKSDLKAHIGDACSWPKSVDGSIRIANLESWEDSTSSPVHTLARTVLSRTDLSALQRREAHVIDTHVFNTEIDFKTGPIANQKQSGRCWLFASTNVLRYSVMRKLNLSEFELSQNHLFFFDKLEKANYYLELTIEHADLETSSRLLSHLSTDLVSDGGQWDMAVNLWETYGCVPQTVYPESYHSGLSAPLNALVKTKVREHALILRNLSKSLRLQNNTDEAVTAMLRGKKEELMAETYRIMTALLGVPPHPNKPFEWSYYDKNGKAGTWTGTPLEFYRTFVGKQPASSFSIINDPRNEYSKLYTVSKLGNIWGGRPVLYVNTEANIMKDIVVKMLKSGEPVFFGCDVMKFEDRYDGILDLDLFDYNVAFDITLNLKKAERLEMGDSSMTHAMVFTGVHLDNDGKIVKFKVENAWGTAIGDKGWFMMTSAWFDQYVYQIVVPRAHAPKDLIQVLDNGNPKVLDPWDPMGALA